MSLSDDVRVWERFAKPDERILPEHHRNGSVALSTPAGRLLEVTQQLILARQYLAEAAVAVKRLEAREQTLHSMKNTSFGGVPMAQTWTDFLLWEGVLNDNPQLTTICELGTWMGGFSLYLAAQARVRGQRFRTYDSVEPERSIPSFVRHDVLTDPQPVIDYLGEGPWILFCDNGNKPRELQTFAPHLTEGSLLVVHDWGTEVVSGDVPDSLEMLYEDFCDQIGSISRVFKSR